MGKIEHLHLHHAPPHPSHCRSKKHHHPYPPPPHCHHHSVEHPADLSRPMDSDSLSPPLDCRPHHHHKKDKLRVQPPKHLRKVRKLHRKLMKAYKLPKNARHGCHHHHYMQFTPPKKGFFHHHHHPPGCCMRSVEEDRFSMKEPCHVRDMSSFHHHHPRCHGGRPNQSCAHEICSKLPLIKSEVVRGKVALASPRLVEAPAGPSIEGAATVAADRATVGEPATDVTPVDDPVPVMPAP